MWQIEKIKERMSEEDKDFLKKIYAPTVVGVQPGDSRNGLCVMPDGEIRHYGERIKTHPWAEAEVCYISSVDGGLTWKYHECDKDVLGSAQYVPELGKYFAATSTVVITKNDETVKDPEIGTYMKISEKGPDDKDYKKVKMCEKSYHDAFLPKYIKAKNRLAVTLQSVSDNEYHPVFAYSDDGGESWTVNELESVPKYEVIYPSISPRWENNGAEPIFTECPDGRLMLLVRNSNDYYHDDYGTTWSKP